MSGWEKRVMVFTVASTVLYFVILFAVYTWLR